ncbi:type IV toxin-antitoxin system AbiEi family antitoxin domain-containing protein [Gracilibacillus timonensis]|uniref:type IV toxin-antitoxin system AbiEi family antitoxin domain-containing protein n=1 Tax=Gracilibacillus timonensis TaxID=1816696 RepID=UPI000825735E|nr:hypothetical protein [Gracilibacillus timonensis]
MMKNSAIECCIERELWYNDIEVSRMIQQRLKSVFEVNNGILTTQMAKDYGINDSTLRKAIERKDIQKHSRGIYLLDNVYFDDLYILQLQYPGAVYSHETAVMLHTLSSYSPFVYHVSFLRGYHLTTAEEQHIKPYYVSKKEWNDEYVELMDSWDSNPLRVTNLEKTVVDMLRHKKPMPGIIDEMINDYITRNDKNLEKLIDYGVRFNVLNIIRERILPFVKPTKNEKFNKAKI